MSNSSTVTTSIETRNTTITPKNETFFPCKPFPEATFTDFAKDNRACELHDVSKEVDNL